MFCFWKCDRCVVNFLEVATFLSVSSTKRSNALFFCIGRVVLQKARTFHQRVRVQGYTPRFLLFISVSERKTTGQNTRQYVPFSTRTMRHGWLRLRFCGYGPQAPARCELPHGAPFCWPVNEDWRVLRQHHRKHRERCCSGMRPPLEQAIVKAPDASYLTEL